MTPLAGRTVLVTRSREQAADLAAELERLGATVVSAPAIAFEDPPEWGPVDDAIRDLADYDWIVFTSANAVDRFVDRMISQGRATLPGGSPRVAAIGRATADRLEAAGLRVNLVATSSRGEGMVEALAAATDLEATRILIPRASAAREVLPEGLRARKARVDVVAVYRTVPVAPSPEVRSMLREGRIDMVVFTSSSTVSSLIEGLGGPHGLEGLAIATIGPVTAETVRGLGLEPAVVADAPSVRELARAIASFYAER